MSRYRIKMNGKVYEMEIELIEEDNEKVLKKAPENEHKSVSNKIGRASCRERV